MAAVEIRVEVTAPDLSAAISELAQAIRGRQQGVMLTTDGVIAGPLDPERMIHEEAVPAVVNPENHPEPEAYQQLGAYVEKMKQQAAQPEPAPVAPVPMPAPEPAPAPSVITLTQIARAGAALVDQGKKAEVLGALRRYGVQAVTQLKPDQLGYFAAELRALGAQI